MTFLAQDALHLCECDSENKWMTRAPTDFMTAQRKSCQF